VVNFIYYASRVNAVYYDVKITVRSR